MGNRVVTLLVLGTKKEKKAIEEYLKYSLLDVFFLLLNHGG